jgi:hypothetical protein
MLMQQSTTQHVTMTSPRPEGGRSRIARRSRLLQAGVLLPAGAFVLGFLLTLGARLRSGELQLADSATVAAGTVHNTVLPAVVPSRNDSIDLPAAVVMQTQAAPAMAVSAPLEEPPNIEYPEVEAPPTYGYERGPAF